MSDDPQRTAGWDGAGQFSSRLEPAQFEAGQARVLIDNQGEAAATYQLSFHSPEDKLAFEVRQSLPRPGRRAG
jgi:hypothetical protein